MLKNHLIGPECRVAARRYSVTRNDFEATLRRWMDVDLTITGEGQYRSRLTQIALRHLYLAAGHESVSRIAFMSMRLDIVLLWWPTGDHTSQIWRGSTTLPGEIVTLNPGESVHARTVGASRWAGLWISTADLASYSQALTGKPIEGVGGIGSWRPDRAALHNLTALHAAAVKLCRNPAKRSSGCQCHSWIGTAVDPRIG